MSKPKLTAYSIFAACVAAIGGILFGYSASVISGVSLFISKDFALSTLDQELVVSTLLIGALIGALLGGFVADWFGRKKTLFLTLVLFFIGSVTLTEAVGFDTLLVGRFISGLGVGIVSMAVPLYIAEMSPPESRGALVSLNQLCITIGILLAYIISYIFAESENWRAMFGFAFLPIGLQFVGLFFIGETPSWLKNNHKTKEAKEVLEKVRGKKAVDLSEVTKLEGTSNKKNWRALFSSSVRLPFLIGIGVAVFQSITGINTVIYYAPKIFELAGYEETQTALFATVLIGVVNVLVTILALWLIDRIGRKPLLITGLIGMGLSLFVLGLAFMFEKGELVGLTSIVSLIVYVSFFALSLGPVAWLIISEIYPLGIRGRAMGIATFTNWLANYFVSLTFLTLVETLSSAGTFWLYALICVLGLVFVIKLVPETKGKTFEQIQDFWKAP